MRPIALVAIADVVACLLASLFGVQAAEAPPLANASSASATCVECLQFRVGVARMVRGPSLTIADNHFTEIELPSGAFRGFDAHATSQAIDGRFPQDMGGAGRTVLGPGPAGTYDSCGQWLNHVEIHGSTTIGLIHAETDCHYDNNGQTHKSMALATSNDFGLHWNSLGQIITGTDKPLAGHESGEGDCTAVDGKDGFLYAYCVRSADRALIAARAPIASLGPGSWHKFYEGTWNEPGLGGRSSRLGNGSGASVARWVAGGWVFTGWTSGGVGLSFSSDGTTLEPMREPILPLDPASGKSASAVDRVLYPVILDSKTGANQLSNTWNLVYAYWPAGQGRDQKYLVFREITASLGGTPTSPQVGVALARWVDAGTYARWSTMAPMPADGEYRLETISGYVMSAPPHEPSVELEDCVSAKGGHDDHMLAEKGFCGTHGYQVLRGSGWLYRDPQAGTSALYRCYDDSRRTHFVSQAPDCEKLATSEKLLGYALKGFASAPGGGARIWPGDRALPTRF